MFMGLYKHSAQILIHLSISSIEPLVYAVYTKPIITLHLQAFHILDIYILVWQYALAFVV